MTKSNGYLPLPVRGPRLRLRRAMDTHSSSRGHSKMQAAARSEPLSDLGLHGLAELFMQGDGGVREKDITISTLISDLCPDCSLPAVTVPSVSGTE